MPVRQPISSPGDAECLSGVEDNDAAGEYRPIRIKLVKGQFWNLNYSVFCMVTWVLQLCEQQFSLMRSSSLSGTEVFLFSSDFSPFLCKPQLVFSHHEMSCYIICDMQWWLIFFFAPWMRHFMFVLFILFDGPLRCFGWKEASERSSQMSTKMWSFFYFFGNTKILLAAWMFCYKRECENLKTNPNIGILPWNGQCQKCFG